MKRIIFIFILLLTAQFSFGQQIISRENLLKSWSENQLDEAGVGSDVVFMDQDEKEVVFICNLARINGPLFVQTILDPYLDFNNIKTDRFVKSLVKTLESQRSISPLIADRLLYQLAYTHAKVSGEKATMGHNGFNSRFNKAKNAYRTFAENCYYGRRNTLEIALGLLIDKGESGLGHRKNILNQDLGFVGVAIQPHRSLYEYNCVMDFGGKW
ncbi:MAG: CAP domain-containing protein [Bacteroidota bacterium]|nr:CAP domain-containing protein [Bacteroidota bacterium]